MRTRGEGVKKRGRRGGGEERERGRTGAQGEVASTWLNSRPPHRWNHQVLWGGVAQLEHAASGWAQRATGVLQRARACLRLD